MAQVKLEEEKELWEPQEEQHRDFKHEPDVRDVECQMVHVKEEPEDVEIKAEPLEFPLVHDSVKSEEEESPLFHQTVKEESREDADGAGLGKLPESRDHADSSSDTDDSEDWAPSAARPAPKTHSEGNREESDGEGSDSGSSWEFHAPVKTPVRTKRKMEENPSWASAGERPPQEPHVEAVKQRHKHPRRKRGSVAKQHVCSFCGRAFRTLSTLRIHVSVHTGEKPFKCAICDKSFVQNHNLTQHLRTHTGERPFKCPVCVKRFNRRGNLYQHLKLHTGKRSFKCSVCEKNFTQMSSLYQLLRSFTAKNLFKCKVCSGAHE